MKEEFLQLLESYMDGFIQLLPKLVIALVFFMVAWFLASYISRATQKRLTKVLDDALLIVFIVRAIKIVLVLVAGFMVLHILGLGVAATGLLGTAGVGAFVIGFAFKDIGEHLLAGVLLAFNRPFRIGDVVELDGELGTVITLNLRNTHIKTFDGKDVYIPNGNIVKQPLINYTIDGFLRNHFEIGLHHKADISKAIIIILDTLKEVDGILLSSKMPSVHILKLTPSTVQLIVYYWIDTFDENISSLMVKTQAIQRTLERLQQAEFELPHQIVEIKKADMLQSV